MKFAIGFAAGLAAAWAALAIWQRVPEFPDLDASEVPDVEELRWQGRTPGEIYDTATDPLRGGCSGFGGRR